MEPDKTPLVYIYDEELVKQCDRIPVIKTRASRVHDLIFSYDLLDFYSVRPSRVATREELQFGHSTDYLDVLQAASNVTDDLQDAEDEEFGLNYDCPKIPKLFHFCKRIAGGTLAAAEAIIDGARVAINWCGGWHHAQRDKAAGFCYVNDIVVGIQRLKGHFDRILYIDLDVHHGDGVENAFSSTPSVLTLSFHQHETGFFPGSGADLFAGFGAARTYAINFPFRQHIGGECYSKYFKLTTSAVVDSYQPKVIVLQCGADILAGDPLGGANLTTRDMGVCVDHVKSFGVPILVLGGGGYNLSNTARHFTYLTAVLCGVDIDGDIPDNDYFLDYGPTYELHVERKTLKDENREEELQRNYEEICRKLRTMTGNDKNI